jgi:hypothetical protein
MRNSRNLGYAYPGVVSDEKVMVSPKTGLVFDPNGSRYKLHSFIDRIVCTEISRGKDSFCCVYKYRSKIIMSTRTPCKFNNINALGYKQLLAATFEISASK